MDQKGGWVTCPARSSELALGLATGAYNDVVGSLESRVLAQAKRSNP